MAYQATLPATDGSLLAADIRENFRALRYDSLVVAGSCTGNSATATNFSSARTLTATGGNVTGTSAATADGNYSIVLNASNLPASSFVPMVAGAGAPINWRDGPIATTVAYPTFALMTMCTSFGSGTVRIYRTHQAALMNTAVYVNGASVEGVGQAGLGVKFTDIAINFGNSIAIYGNWTTSPTDRTITDIYAALINGVPCIGAWYD